jgi:autotransporter-associated beta strand protein
MVTYSDKVGAVILTSGTITGTSGVLQGTSYDVRSGTISAILGQNGTATLTKTTSGTVSLSKANTYTGATDIKAGMILVKLASALNNTAVTVRSGATLAVDSGVILTKTATWESGAILGGNGKYDIGAAFGPAGIHIAPGMSVGTLTVDDGVNLSSGGNLDIEVDGTQTQQADLLQVTKTTGLGNLTLGATSVLNVTEINPGTFTSIAIVTYAGSLTGTFAPANTHLPPGYSISYDTPGQILLLPEPATMALLGLGAFGIAFNRRRRR